MRRWLQLSEECIKFIAMLLTKEECFTEPKFKIIEEFFDNSITCDNVSDEGREHLQLLYKTFMELHEFRAKELGWIEDDEENT